MKMKQNPNAELIELRKVFLQAALRSRRQQRATNITAEFRYYLAGCLSTERWAARTIRHRLRRW
jgi:hypothetical protein